MSEFLPSGSSNIDNDNDSFEDHDDDRLASFLRRKRKKENVKMIWGLFRGPKNCLILFPILLLKKIG